MIDLKKILELKLQNWMSVLSRVAQGNEIKCNTNRKSTHDQTRQIANQMFNSFVWRKISFGENGNLVKEEI